MPYLHCGRCGLQIRIQATYTRVDNCPRCLARHAAVSPLVPSSRWASPAGGYGRGEPERPADPRDPQR